MAPSATATGGRVRPIRTSDETDGVGALASGGDAPADSTRPGPVREAATVGMPAAILMRGRAAVIMIERTTITTDRPVGAGATHPRALLD